MTASAPDPRLAGLPDAAIGLALGMSVARPSAVYAGRVSALVDELRRRGVWAEVLAALDPQLAQAVTVVYRADRGQRWARAGHS